MKTMVTILICLALASVSSAAGPNLIVNGDFEAGNSGFTSEYVFQDPIEPVSNTLMWGEETYTVYSSTQAVHYLWTDVTDHSDGQLMLIVNGADSGQEPIVWAQDVVVEKNTLYLFTYYLATSYPESPATLKCIINGADIGTATAHTDPADGWLEVSYEWNSGDSELAQISLVDLNSQHTGNDFVIDDMSLCSTVIDVDIDIKPGSYPNAINKNGKGVIPVAILGSADFDVSQIDISTLSFGGLAVRVKGNGTPQCSIEDVSGDFTDPDPGPQGGPDGYDDLVCQFEDDPSTWTVGDGEATLTGQLIDGTPFEGTDLIKVVQ